MFGSVNSRCPPSAVALSLTSLPLPAPTSVSIAVGPDEV
jgi:hypothetical protein